MPEDRSGADVARAEGVRALLGRLYLYQAPMVRVLIALVPAVVGSVYFFGWRSLSVIFLCLGLGSFVEWLFCRRRGEKISSAALVTAALLALTLPPTVPYFVAAVGVVVAIAFGKEVFGGFGRNVYNPALVGRCFIYVCFPVAMTGRWLAPYSGFPAGLVHWLGAADAVTRATPLVQFGAGSPAPVLDLFLGNVGGSLGETSALLILLGAAYLVVTKTANWRIIVSCVGGAAGFSALFRWVLGAQAVVPGPLYTVLGGGFLFASVFMATDPVSAPNTDEGRYVYGVCIGGLTVIIRGFSNFAGGVMFAILLMNTFTPIMDHGIREWKRARSAPPESAGRVQKEPGSA